MEEDIIISLLPVVIVVGVWIFIMKRIKNSSKDNKYTQNQNEMILLLKEIKDELKELNKKNSNK